MSVIGPLLEALLSSPAFRALVEGIALKFISEILHRRSVDPQFLKDSDVAFSSLMTAKTDEELTDAQNQVRRLMSNR